jgi:hypothetical protein
MIRIRKILASIGFTAIMFAYSGMVVFSLLLNSCTSSSNNSQEAPKQSRQKESTGQTVDKYVNTLTTAQDKARKAAGAENKRMEEANKSAQGMEKQQP